MLSTVAAAVGSSFTPRPPPEDRFGRKGGTIGAPPPPPLPITGPGEGGVEPPPHLLAADLSPPPQPLAHRRSREL